MRLVTDVEFDGIDHRDRPDYCDAFISSACWQDTGEELAEPELDTLNDNSPYVYELLMDYLY